MSASGPREGLTSLSFLTSGHTHIRAHGKDTRAYTSSHTSVYSYSMHTCVPVRPSTQLLMPADALVHTHTHQLTSSALTTHKQKSTCPYTHPGTQPRKPMCPGKPTGAHPQEGKHADTKYQQRHRCPHTQAQHPTHQHPLIYTHWGVCAGEYSCQPMGTHIGQLQRTHLHPHTHTLTHSGF